MNLVLAIGGLDDVAMSLGEAIIVGVFLIVGGLVTFAWWKRSLVAAVIASVLILADGTFFHPWTVIAHSTPHDANDAYWLSRLRIISIIWLVLVITAAVCMGRVIRQRKTKRD